MFKTANMCFCLGIATNTFNIDARLAFDQLKAADLRHMCTLLPHACQDERCVWGDRCEGTKTCIHLPVGRWQWQPRWWWSHTRRQLPLQLLWADAVLHGSSRDPECVHSRHLQHPQWPAAQLLMERNPDCFFKCPCPVPGPNRYALSDSHRWSLKTASHACRQTLLPEPFKGRMCMPANRSICHLSDI